MPRRTSPTQIAPFIGGWREIVTAAARTVASTSCVTRRSASGAWREESCRPDSAGAGAASVCGHGRGCVRGPSAHEPHISFHAWCMMNQKSLIYLGRICGGWLVLRCTIWFPCQNKARCVRSRTAEQSGAGQPRASAHWQNEHVEPPRYGTLDRVVSQGVRSGHGARCAVVRSGSSRPPPAQSQVTLATHRRLVLLGARLAPPCRPLRIQ